MHKENQRIAISKRLLKEALLRLLNHKHISAVSISELCTEAGINRTTFYRHYETPHDVLLEMALEFNNLFYDMPVSSQDETSLKRHLSRICQFLYDNAEIVRIFIRNSSNSDFTQIFQDFLTIFLSTRIVLYKGHIVDNETLQLLTTFYAHGVRAIVHQWLIEDIPKTPAEIAELIFCSFNNDFTYTRKQ